MNKELTVSVVICTYNGEKFLREQLDSIIAQTYPIAEIIVQDDCSTDHTVDIIKEYASTQSNIRLYQNKQNLGYNLNFKTAVKHATSDFVALSDQDDVWMPEKIARQIAEIGNHDISFCDIYRGESKQHSIIIRMKYSVESLLFHAIVGHVMLLRKDFVQDDSHWLEYWPYDRSLALLAHIDGKGIAKVDAPLVWHRKHEGEVTYTKKTNIGKCSKWAPYIYGWSDYRRIQKTSKWHNLFSTLYRETQKHGDSLVNKILKDMLSNRTTALIHLCWVCLRNKEKIYPGKTDGLMGNLRGLCHPAIFAYFNKEQFAPQKNNKW